MESQVVMNEAITKAMAEVTRVLIQAFTETQSQRPEDQWGPKLGGPDSGNHNLTGRQLISTPNGKCLY